LTNHSIDASRPQVRKFGLLFAALCAAGVAASLFKQSLHWPWFAAGAVFFLTTGLFAYPVLRPIYVGWMTFAQVLAWINTRIILGAFFYVALTAVGLLLRLVGKDFLDERMDRNASTYWITHSPGPFQKTKYEHLF
jgi:hypothetical protein